MQIILCTQEDTHFLEQAASILVRAFPNSYGKPPNQAMDELISIYTAGGLLIVAIQEAHLLGFVGSIPQYGHIGWELHPLVVAEAFRRQGIGLRLVAALEDEVRRRGGVMIYLGADDEDFATSLSQDDLFVNTFEKIRQIKNIKDHPFEFYQKAGYQIVGVLPDANGLNKPDIYMAKRLVKYQSGE